MTELLPSGDLQADPPVNGPDSIPALDSDTQAGIEALPAEDGKTAVPDEQQHLRVFKPGPLPDDIQTAVAAAKASVVPVVHNRPNPKPSSDTLTAIGQDYVGELTGSITGNVYCYGYAIHEGLCIYVNMGGPRTAVEAIRAKFGKGEIVTLIPWDGPALELTAGDGNTGMYTDFMQSIPEAHFTSLILGHDLLVHPNYGGLSTTFIVRIDDVQAAAKLRQHVTELVKVPVFEAWESCLYQAGQAAKLIRSTHSGGGIDLLTVTLDAEAWTRLIAGSVAEGMIALPAFL